VEVGLKLIPSLGLPSVERRPRREVEAVKTHERGWEGLRLKHVYKGGAREGEGRKTGRPRRTTKVGGSEVG